MTISHFPSLLDHSEIQHPFAKRSCRIFSVRTAGQCILHKQLPTKVWPCPLRQVTSSYWPTPSHSQFGKASKEGFEYRQLTATVQLQEVKQSGAENVIHWSPVHLQTRLTQLFSFQLHRKPQSLQHGYCWREDALRFCSCKIFPEKGKEW